MAPREGGGVNGTFPVVLFQIKGVLKSISPIFWKLCSRFNVWPPGTYFFGAVEAHARLWEILFLKNLYLLLSILWIKIDYIWESKSSYGSFSIINSWLWLYFFASKLHLSPLFMFIPLFLCHMRLYWLQSANLICVI